MSSIEIHKNSITHLSTDAIVNAANNSLSEGGGVCGAIFSAAGAKLKSECEKYGYCNTGDAVITSACDMKNAKYIIHAVGPVYDDGKHGEPEQLYSCYKKSLALAREKHCRSIGFPLISSGIFGYPLEDAWRIALTACSDYISENLDFDISIVFVARSRETVELGKQIYKELSAVRIPDCRILTKYLGVLNREKSAAINSLLIQDIDYFVETHKELNLTDYGTILNKSGIVWSSDSMRNADVDKLDAVTVLALLVAAYRADRFSDGAFEEFVSNGSITKWLERLQKLSSQ